MSKNNAAILEEIVNCVKRGDKELARGLALHLDDQFRDNALAVLSR